jgi:membrane protease YdiL (CAAX protease family)
MVMVDSIGLLLVNLFVIAILPAIGEELFFRGSLMRIFGRFIPNIHLNIIIIAFIFSFIHLQFYGFLPRFLLGILLGYAYVYTRSIWMPILIHFINNAISTFAYYFYASGKIEVNPDELGTNFSPVLLILNIGLIILIFRYLYKNKPKTVLWR